jgi:para-nitrobenzyl esterase
MIPFMTKFWMGLALIALAAHAKGVHVDAGLLEGGVGVDPSIRVFRGVPFAAPPVGPLRCAPPQPVKAWKGVRAADKFAAHCVQARVFDDIIFRGEMSEDCLNLTVWTPAKSGREQLPVYVWFYGGGFTAGGGDEPRYDGESIARHGIVVVNVNYRLGVFGFFAHPELTAESPHKASGNYGFLDQVAALQWVRKNIAAFGGDPRKVTIGGESAGSLSVSALMASPLSRDLFQQAIGESGAFFGSVGGRATPLLTETERQGSAFAAAVGAKSLAELRASPADKLLQEASKPSGGFASWPSVDGYFLTGDVASVFAQGKQAKVPLLAGWNADEVRMMVTLAREKPTAQTFSEQLKRTFKDHADDARKVYPASTDPEAVRSSGDLASDNFIVHGTWKWLELQAKAGVPVYRFQFDRQVPIPEARKTQGLTTLGAAHASELEYVYETFDSKKADWQPEDRAVGRTMNAYWANFIKTGNPNGAGLADWPEFGKSRFVMHLDVESRAKRDDDRARQEFLESVLAGTGSR